MFELLPHQIEALNQTAGFHNTAIYYDMGLGKTFIGSEAMVRYCCKVNLVICQKSKVQDWVDHFLQNYQQQGIPMNVFDLTKKNELQYFLQAVQMNVTNTAVINYELAWRRKDLLKLKDFCLMLDESSLIQNPKAKQTKFIMKLKPLHVILLSGTPVGGKYENLWTQLHLLGWSISESLYEKQYVNWKLTQPDFMGKKHKIVDKSDPYKNIERLKSKMREYGAVFKKTEECFQLPAQTFSRIMIPASKEYKKFRKNSVIVIDDKELVGDTTLTKILYSRQLCGHFNQDKLQAVTDLIQSTNERLIIFYSFNDELSELKRICNELNRPVSEVNGHCKDLTAYEQESNSVTLCQYQSASKGLNLQKCNRIIYFTLPLSSEDFEQSKKRIHRIGQNLPCFYYLLICRDTVEEDILQTLESRKDYTDELFKERK